MEHLIRADASTEPTMKELLEQHFGHILTNRADKRWTPHFVGCPEVAAAYPEISGIAVTSDPYVEPQSLELRTETGTLCAKLNRIRLPD